MIGKMVDMLNEKEEEDAKDEGKGKMKKMK